MERRKVLQSHYRAVLDRTMRCWWITLRCVTAKPDCQLATVKFSVMDHRRTSVRVTDKPAFFFLHIQNRNDCVGMQAMLLATELGVGVFRGR